MRSDADRIKDIAKSILIIEMLAAGGKEAFVADQAIQERIIYHFQVIGEAANGISRATLSQYPDVNWSEVVGFRNVLVHQYWAIDLEIVWSVTQLILPGLKPIIEQMEIDLGL